MYWFRRPPYLRWAAAGLLVLVALAVELLPEPRRLHPFAARSFAVGDVVSDTDVDWRPVPAGLLPETALVGGIVARAVPEGNPFLPGDVGTVPPVPAGWWSVPIEIPPAPPGTPVRVVLVTADQAVDGLVVAPPDDDPFSIAPVGLVAVPGETAAAVAAAAARRDVIVLIGQAAPTP